LNRRHLYRQIEVQWESGFHDPVLDALGEQLVRGLPHDLAAVGEDENSLSIIDRVPDEPRRDDGLAASGRCHEQDAALPGSDGAVDFGEDRD
jgi:hypothetical protein